ncbi:putative quinone oxidoreductase [Coniochaeta ligniaria NRRL 30616]|uniref:Putative quinone oxidoreductase n=1 Tax=Coniochaeta ligniaria NRRL 30616 TaxID=1408157 RepID=A0A1J7K0H2_9PEZI|nr:putative quinone oxidoreductase [Coniochaeta ligniaria NRRL 30616]
MTPTYMRQWVLRGQGSFDCLRLEEAPIPEVGENDVLVKLHAVSLNYRDLMIATGTYYWPRSDPVVPVSDGAGEVISVGAKVSRFKPGQRAIPTFYQGFIGGALSAEVAVARSLGAVTNGVLREYAVFNEEGLVHAPSNLSYREAATLPCAALTAWNALYGPRPLRAGDTVLTQGTGGVSLFAVQLAAAAGAEVISTTSSSEKEERLRQLGAQQVINYKQDPNWGETAKKLSLGQAGANYVVEIGGPKTLVQSSKAAAIGGELSIIGNRSAEAGSKEIAAWSPHTAVHGTRRIAVGSRLEFEDMNRAIEVNKITPVIDARVFAFEEAVEAFQYLWDAKHFGKVVIQIV